MNYSDPVTKVYRFDEVESKVFRADSRKKLFSDDNFVEKIYHRLNVMLPQKGILSLDVFDTLIFRDSSSELTRFYEIGQLMANFVNDASKTGNMVDLDPNITVRGIDAFWARYMGTKATYRASKPVQGCREGSLREIHLTASRMLCGSSSFVDAFIDIELDYEAARLEKNDMILEYARKYKNKGGRVVLVSDMYMHSEHINELLCRLDIDPILFDGIFSSADSKVSKSSGGIFSKVESFMHAESKEFVHVGDSYKGDYKSPKENGWNALHIPIPEVEIIARRTDHLKTARHLQDIYNLSVDIAMP